jgi:hypothetical protein
MLPVGRRPTMSLSMRPAHGQRLNPDPHFLLFWLVRASAPGATRTHTRPILSRQPAAVGAAEQAEVG